MRAIKGISGWNKSFMAKIRNHPCYIYNRYKISDDVQKKNAHLVYEVNLTGICSQSIYGKHFLNTLQN